MMVISADIILTKVLRLEDILPADNVTYDKNKPPTFRQVSPKLKIFNFFCLFFFEGFPYLTLISLSEGPLLTFDVGPER